MERRMAPRPRSSGLLAPAFGLLLAPLALAGALVAGPGAIPACAAAGGPHAALVVATGDRVLRACVTLDASSVTAIHVIELAHAQDGLEYRLGFGGQAVCALAGVGSDSGDCFGSYPDYWGFWAGIHGAWVWSGSGAGSALIHDGDVEGWSWGSGDTGTTHPPPPPTTEASVCGASVPQPSPTGSGRSPSRPPPRASAAPSPTGPSSPGTSEAGDGGMKQEKKAIRSTQLPGSPVSSDSPGRIVAAAATTGGGGAGGPPAGAAIAVAAAALLGLAGWLRIRGHPASAVSDSSARERHP
jgi:hypothetical protein